MKSQWLLQHTANHPKSGQKINVKVIFDDRQVMFEYIVTNGINTGAFEEIPVYSKILQPSGVIS